MDELAPLDSALAGLIERVGPQHRRTLARAIAADLRRSNAERIAANQNPDGSPYAPRKPQLRHRIGGVRRKMFSKLRTAKWMKIEASASSAAVTFDNRVQHIAQVHQFGLRDKVNRLRSDVEAQYPRRELLGMSAADIDKIEQTILEAITL
jgi:phage virion morphogenesis protein